MQTQEIAPSHHALLVAYGNFLFKYRNRIFPLVLVGICLAFAPVLSAGLAVGGYALALSGQLLRAVVIGLAYIKRGGLNKKVYADTLVTTGFFTACRNPLYVGNVMIYAGLLIMHGNPYVLLLGCLFFVSAYIAIIAAEETYLAEKFGREYQDYCAKVPRWWIRFERLPQGIKGMRFDMRKVIYKDYSTFANLHAQAIFLLAYREYVATGTLTIQWPIALLAVAVIALAIRVVKKRYPL